MIPISSTPTPTKSVTFDVSTTSDSDSVSETQRAKDIRARVLIIIGSLGVMASIVTCGVLVGVLPENLTIPAVILTGAFFFISLTACALGCINNRELEDLWESLEV